MTAPELLLLALGLAMDATAVAVSLGMATPGAGWGAAARAGGMFGAASTLFPALGCWVGAWLGPRVAAFDHWLAFGVLAFLGVRQAWGGLRGRGPGLSVDPTRPLAAPPHPGLLTLAGLAVATAMDTLAVGLTLPLMGAALLPAVLTIGAVTAVAAATGLRLGGRLAERAGPRLEVAGGLILLLVGVKLLLEHLAG